MGDLATYKKEYEISERSEKVSWESLLKNSKSLLEILHENQIKCVKDLST